MISLRVNLGGTVLKQSTERTDVMVAVLMAISIVSAGAIAVSGCSAALCADGFEELNGQCVPIDIEQCATKSDPPRLRMMSDAGPRAIVASVGSTPVLVDDDRVRILGVDGQPVEPGLSFEEQGALLRDFTTSDSSLYTLRLRYAVPDVFLTNVYVLDRINVVDGELQVTSIVVDTPHTAFTMPSIGIVPSGNVVVAQATANAIRVFKHYPDTLASIGSYTQISLTGADASREMDLKFVGTRSEPLLSYVRDDDKVYAGYLDLAMNNVVEISEQGAGQWPRVAASTEVIGVAYVDQQKDVTLRVSRPDDLQCDNPASCWITVARLGSEAIVPTTTRPEHGIAVAFTDNTWFVAYGNQQSALHRIDADSGAPSGEAISLGNDITNVTLHAADNGSVFIAAGSETSTQVSCFGCPEPTQCE